MVRLGFPLLSSLGWLDFDMSGPPPMTTTLLTYTEVSKWCRFVAYSNVHTCNMDISAIFWLLLLNCSFMCLSSTRKHTYTHTTVCMLLWTGTVPSAQSEVLALAHAHTCACPAHTPCAKTSILFS